METTINTASVWEQFQQRLRAFLLTRIEDHSCIDDLLQDIFIKIHVNLHKLRDSDRLESWVFQITRNTLTDYYRARKKDRAPNLPELHVDENVWRPNIEGCLQPFINRLPEKYKEAIMSTDLGKLTQKSFAESKGIPISTVKSQVQRARKMLKEQFRECCEPVSDKYGNIVDKKPCNNCDASHDEEQRLSIETSFNH